VSDNGNVVARGSSKRTTVTHLLLDVGDNGTLWAGAERKDVSDVQAGVLSSVDELTGVHSLVGDEGLGVSLVSVWVAELDAGEWRTTTWVVDDLLHDSTEVSMALGEVEDSELSWVLVEAGVGCEDRATTLSLVTNDSSPLEPKVSNCKQELRNFLRAEFVWESYRVSSGSVAL